MKKNFDGCLSFKHREMYSKFSCKIEKCILILAANRCYESSSTVPRENMRVLLVSSSKEECSVMKNERRSSQLLGLKDKGVSLNLHSFVLDKLSAHNKRINILRLFKD